MDDDAPRLKELLRGQLDPDEEDALETKLQQHPRLRRELANLALETEQSDTRPAIRVRRAELRPEPDPNRQVDVGATLGRGGMAVVRLGRQLKLDRSVAVKTLRGERRSKTDVERLLREARITGRLEHPNIVPVHDIVSGDDGVPQVVLKLIEGHTWNTLMRDPDRVRELFGANDLLEWNLGVLMAVCRALSFAHSRGVLHRDVKPANVMLGPFGEIYLLDWGIAVDLDDPDSHEDPGELAGTSGYMAPEQILGGRTRLGTWTDTYLLGATLHHVLTGRPPHSDNPITARIGSILDGEPAPPLPDDVPQELRRIVESALESDPRKRTARPEDFRLALAGFLQHRGALRLAERGQRECAAAKDAHERGDTAEWERAGLAAELAYRASLEEWPECAEAATGLLQLVALRVEHALATEDPHAATRMVEAHPDLPDELRQRVAAALARAEEEKARLRRIVTDADRGLGHKVRGILGAVFGLVWVGFWCVVAFSPPKSVTPFIAFTVSFFFIGLAVVATRGRQMFENRINRTSISIIVSGMAMTIVWCLGASWLGLDMRTVIIGLLLVWALFASGMATLMDPWGTVSVIGFATAFLAACYEPNWTPYAVVGGNAVLIINQIVLNIALARRGFDAPPAVNARPGLIAPGAGGASGR